MLTAFREWFHLSRISTAKLGMVLSWQPPHVKFGTVLVKGPGHASFCMWDLHVSLELQRRTWKDVLLSLTLMELLAATLRDVCSGGEEQTKLMGSSPHRLLWMTTNQHLLQLLQVRPRGLLKPAVTSRVCPRVNVPKTPDLGGIHVSCSFPSAEQRHPRF